jgi:hypothetical protein
MSFVSEPCWVSELKVLVLSSKVLVQKPEQATAVGLGVEVLQFASLVIVGVAYAGALSAMAPAATAAETISLRITLLLQKDEPDGGLSPFFTDQML